MYRSAINSSKNYVKNISPNSYWRRYYHSENGVYGYRPKPIRDYKVPETFLQSRKDQSNVYRWIEGYRQHGHKIATINPIDLDETKPFIPELQPEYYGLTANENITPNGIVNIPSSSTTINELENILKQIYCGSTSAEFSYIESSEEKEWLAHNYENLMQEGVSSISLTEKIDVATLLIKSQAWDNFLATKFQSVKRYGGEGAESSLAFFYQLFKESVNDNIKHLIIGMPHRGRGNILTTMFNIRPAKFFRKFQGGSEFPDDVIAMGDVVSHYHVSEDFNIEGKNLRISMLRNPSHLEAVNPVSMGKTRSKQQTLSDGSYGNDSLKEFSTDALNIQLHGDAAFSGQGINQECLMMSQVPNFDVGGTIHLIINNQIGFTTPANRGRSSRYCSDLVKSIQVPVFHVNGDDPDAVLAITKLAFQYQRKFRKDVFIDLNCFRKWGHNELDDPTFTNPALYSIINSKKTVPDLYSENLINANILDSEKVKEIRTEFMAFLNKELSNVNTYVPEPCYFEKQWHSIQQANPDAITYWDTGLDYSLLDYIGRTSVSYPDDFNIHPHLLKTYIQGRLKKLEDGKKIDWATAEALAMGSLMYQGHNVRISGEDVGRGTFSHRHCMLVDQKTNDIFIPLNTLEGGLGGKLEVANSILSEEAVLGYEYGMAIDNPNNLIIWEAQFGDFYNGAQIMIDNFIVSGETKWMESNGLVMLLPHGYDGAASEHSSCRMERFLQLTDSKETSPDGDIINLHIINPTTPAQYYHALRRQIVRNFRKPLLIVAPKVLLRLSDATSTYVDFQPGTFFRNVIGDDTVDPKNINKVILCSGKHYYNLNAERISKNITNTAIIRLETLSPFPLPEIQEEIGKYPNVKKFIWSQEESRNMGAWSFVRPRFEYLIGKSLKYCGRPETPTTAAGDGKIHRKEVEEIVMAPFKL